MKFGQEIATDLWFFMVRSLQSLLEFLACQRAMLKKSIYVLLLSVAVNLVKAGDFNPNVTIAECSTTSVTIHLRDAAEGGLIYIQGKGSACKRTTSGQPKKYEFDMDICNIKLDSMFRVIIQKQPHVQTGADKVIPIMCVVDMSDLVVNGVVNPMDGLDNDGINKTVKPRARMRVLSHEKDVSRGEVTLNDPLTMEIVLDEEFMVDFDIKAKECTASLIKIVNDECSPDEKLFPNFDKKRKGDLTSNFNAFQPTDLTGSEAVDVAYTCQLSVCKNNCQRTHCGDIIGWGRRKRSSDDEVEEITVGTSVRVVAPYKSLQFAENPSDFCIEKIFVYVFLIIIGVVLIGSWSAVVFLVKRLITSGGDPNMNIAKTVGRRLSSILNIPTGYDFKDQRTFTTIPEEEGYMPQQRRKSVTMTRVGPIDDDY